LISREEGAITADIRAYDDSGELLLEVVSGRSEKVRSPGAEAGHGERLLYQPGWEPLNLEALDTPGNPRRYLCFADEGGITARVAQLLDRRGARVTVEAAISDQRDLRGLLDRVQPEVIVHGFSLDLPDPESQPAERLMSSQSRGVEHALELARVLAESKTRADVVFLTCGAQAVNPNDACSGLAAAPLAGFARVARSELADHQWRLIDLDPARPAECAEEVCRELEIGAGEREIAYRDGQRYVHRLRRLGSGSLPAQRAKCIRSGCTSAHLGN
jgi:hypothetical protein